MQSASASPRAALRAARIELRAELPGAWPAALWIWAGKVMVRLDDAKAPCWSTMTVASLLADAGGRSVVTTLDAVIARFETFLRPPEDLRNDREFQRFLLEQQVLSRFYFITYDVHPGFERWTLCDPERVLHDMQAAGHA